MKREEKIPVIASLCWCAERDGTKVHAEKCIGVKTYLSEIMDVNVDMNAKCREIDRFISDNIITGHECSVTINENMYEVESLAIFGGGRCGRMRLLELAL